MRESRAGLCWKISKRLDSRAQASDLAGLIGGYLSSISEFAAHFGQRHDQAIGGLAHDSPPLSERARLQASR